MLSSVTFQQARWLREPVGKVNNLQKSAVVYENKSQDTCFAAVVLLKDAVQTASFNWYQGAVEWNTCMAPHIRTSYSPFPRKKYFIRILQWSEGIWGRRVKEFCSGVKESGDVAVHGVNESGAWSEGILQRSERMRQ